MKAKKFLALILILAMLTSLGTVFAMTVHAAEDEAAVEVTAEVSEAEDEFSFSLSFGFSFEALFEKLADDLKALGLFLGTDNGYELDREPTRDEAATMLVRLLGKEAEAKEEDNAHPFTDVPEWANPYVGYLYANELTLGISEDLFGSKDLCSAQMFCTFVLRALGYVDTGDETDFTYAEAVAFATEIGLVSEGILAYGELEFTRAGCVYIMGMALLANMNGAETTLLAKLVADGAVEQEAAEIFLAQADLSEPKDESEDEPKDESEDEPKDESEDEPKDESEDEPKDESEDEPKDKSEDEPKDESEDEPKDEPKDESGKENLTEEDLNGLITIITEGLTDKSLESNVDFLELLSFASFMTIDAIENATKEMTEEGALWTIGIKNETFEVIVCVYFDLEGNFTELLAAGLQADKEAGSVPFELKIKAK